LRGAADRVCARLVELNVDCAIAAATNIIRICRIRKDWRGLRSPDAFALGPRVGANAEGLPPAQKIDIAAVKLTGAQSPRYPLIASAVRIAPKSAAMPRDGIRKLQENFSSRRGDCSVGRIRHNGR